MSEEQTTEQAGAYDVTGVTITPVGGGYYDLTHPSLADPERVRGKEVAETRATEIAAAAVPPEGSMSPQPSLDDVLKDARIAELEARLAAAEEAARNATVTTVMQTGGEAAPVPGAHMFAPQAYTGTLTDEQKAAIKLPTSRIILEDNADIPPTGLFVSVNGRAFQISTGVEVDVPDFVLEVLDNAVISLPVVDNATQKVMGYRDRSKYPYRRIQS